MLLYIYQMALPDAGKDGQLHNSSRPCCLLSDTVFIIQKQINNSSNRDQSLPVHSPNQPAIGFGKFT